MFYVYSTSGLVLPVKQQFRHVTTNGVVKTLQPLRCAPRILFLEIYFYYSVIAEIRFIRDYQNTEAAT